MDKLQCHKILKHENSIQDVSNEDGCLLTAYSKLREDCVKYHKSSKRSHITQYLAQEMDMIIFGP